MKFSFSIEEIQRILSTISKHNQPKELLPLTKYSREVTAQVLEMSRSQLSGYLGGSRLLKDGRRRDQFLALIAALRKYEAGQQINGQTQEVNS